MDEAVSLLPSQWVIEYTNERIHKRKKWKSKSYNCWHTVNIYLCVYVYVYLCEHPSLETAIVHCELNGSGDETTDGNDLSKAIQTLPEGQASLANSTGT